MDLPAHVVRAAHVPRALNLEQRFGTAGVHTCPEKKKRTILFQLISITLMLINW